MTETSAPPVSVVEFLTARYDEEAEDFTLPRPSRTLGGDDYSHGAHREDCACLLVSGIGTRDLDCDCGYPAKVLREIAAKRAIIALHEGEHDCPGSGDGYNEVLERWTPGVTIGWDFDNDREIVGRDCDILRLLASPYSDHPDFDLRWAV